MKQIRWQQRFQNYERAFSHLERALAIGRPSETERAGTVQFFELTFELAWKTLKDYLETQGFQLNTPRDVFKQAYQANVISQGDVWLEALDNRNLTTHVYDEATALKVVGLIRDRYFSLLQELHKEFQSKKST
ncbi:MAG: nucleotidyltransferase substrate binding protein [Deltaproteobacteria bacterium]|nr:nucleotidyltransferase substrate binding protein [Deltaproteobacteria bacterium]